MLIDGTVVRDLVVRFESGRVVQLDASTAQETMRTIITRDDGAARLGEVALVDREGRIGALDTVFYDTLLDENAASHIALGRAFPFLADDEETAARMNESDIHIDFMIGRAGADGHRHHAPTASACPCSSTALADLGDPREPAASVVGGSSRILQSASAA